VTSGHDSKPWQMRGRFRTFIKPHFGEGWVGAEEGIIPFEHLICHLNQAFLVSTAAGNYFFTTIPDVEFYATSSLCR
jgi:hypothetical protein